MFFGGGTFVMEEGVFLKWRGAECVFWRGYFCSIPDQEEHAQVSQTLCSLDGDLKQLQSAIFPLASSVIDGVDQGWGKYFGVCA